MRTKSCTLMEENWMAFSLDQKQKALQLYDEIKSVTKVVNRNQIRDSSSLLRARRKCKIGIRRKRVFKGLYIHMATTIHQERTIGFNEFDRYFQRRFKRRLIGGITRRIGCFEVKNA